MTCHHICRCGAELRCPCGPEYCAAGAHWQCPNCEQDDFDAYVTMLETDREMTRHEPKQSDR